MNRIKELRKELNITQLQLAKKMQVRQTTISNWETGLFEPDFDALSKMATIFGCSVDYIICHTDTKRAPESEKSAARKRIDAAVEGMTDAELDWFADQIEGLKRIWSEKK